MGGRDVYCVPLLPFVGLGERGSYSNVSEKIEKLQGCFRVVCNGGRG